MSEQKNVPTLTKLPMIKGLFKNTFHYVPAIVVFWVRLVF